MSSDRALLGRRHECARLEGLLDAVRAGESRVLVLRGEAGIGKTALLRYVIDRAAEFRVLRASGVQSEMELAFAGLHQLCAPVLDRVGDLPEPQRDALSTALGLANAGPPERFRVGLAVIGLLAEASGDQPVLCAIDDAQWLDQASLKVLGFVARRADAGRVGLVFGVREPSDDSELRVHPDLRVDGLDDASSRALLDSVVTGRIDERVRERIVAETRGNPLALLELPRGWTPTQLAGGLPFTQALPLESRLEQSFADRLEGLPPESRRLVLIAAVEPVGDPLLLWRAAERLGISREAAEPALTAGLLELGTQVRLFHPLVRSAAVRAASVEQRRAVHGALAEATDPVREPDRRAWHRGEAAPGPDAAIADQLERSADSARARGGLAAAAAFLERATALTVDPERRTTRALAAAEAKQRAGAGSDALALLHIVYAGPSDELQRARADLIRTRVDLAVRRDHAAMLAQTDALKALERLDPIRARAAYVEALADGALGENNVERAEIGRGIRRLSMPAEPSAAELFLIGWAEVESEGFPAGTGLIKEGVRRLRTMELSRDEEIGLLWLACRSAMSLWDNESWHVLSERYVELTRDAGLLTALPFAIELQCTIHVYEGGLARAAELVDRGAAVATAIGSLLPWDGSTLLAAWQEEEGAGLARLDAQVEEAIASDRRDTASLAEYAKAIMLNAAGRYEAALGAAQRSCDHHPGGGFAWVLVELAEAAARSGRPELARATRDRIEPRTELAGTDWALGVQARLDALLSGGAQAEELYREAIERLTRCRMRPDLGRAHLLYGEALRRAGRRVDARRELRAAFTLFSDMGSPVYAERAARELRATGETARRRVDGTREGLTAQEAEIARLARDGLSNPEIAARLFISPRTVEYHLHKVFSKLGISSRQQLVMVEASALA